MRLSRKLPLALSGVLLVGATSAGVAIVSASRDALRDQAVEANRHSVIAYASAVQNYLEGASALVRAEATNPTVIGYREADSDTAVRASVRRMLTASAAFDHILLLSPDGSVVLLEPSARQASLSATNLTFLSWMRDVVRTGSPAVSDLHISPVTQAPSVVVAAPLRDARGRIVGVLAGALDLQRLSLVSRVPRGPSDSGGAFGLLADSHGLIVAHQHNPNYVAYQTDFSASPAVRAALAGRSGQGEWFNPVDQEEKLGAYRPLAASGWAVVYATPKDIALRPARELAETVARYALTGTLLLMLLGHLMVRRGLRPLRDLSAASAAIARGQEPSPVVVASRDEVAELAAAFADMQTRLSERDAALTEQTERLEQANGELEAFSYSVSHDLRTPLRAIDGFSNILLEDYGSALEPEASALLTRVRAAASRMGCLIDDLLELSRVGRLELKREDVDVSELCAECIRELATVDPGRTVTVTIEPSVVMNGDRRLLRSVVDNLLDNAWKFTSKTPDARIEVRSTPSPDGPGLCIRDNGVGFAMEDSSRIFGAFQRLHSSTEFPGTGIGLATVQRIVRRHDGLLLAWSEPGQGASFLFTLSGGSHDAAETALLASAGLGTTTPPRRSP